ncbi:MAG: TIGR02300 family protein [Parvularculaceae bacterium]|nr:TIGR02300 family protein [Parvularculaceae bacterium]
MSKPELGIKRDCPNCTARFYDLNKSPAHCPKCAHDFVPEALLKPRKPRREDEPAEAAEAPKPAAEVPLASADKDQKGAKSKKKPGLDDEPAGEEDLGDDIDLEIEDDEEDDTLLEEDEDDDEDMGGIISGGDEEP